MNREPLSLLVFVEKTLPDYVSFEPETVKEALALNDIELDKLMACRVTVHNFKPFTDWHIFEKTVIAFNDRKVNPAITQEITPAEITYAVKCMREIDKVTPFSDEVLAFIATLFHHDGLILVPKIFDHEDSETGHTIKSFLDHANKGNKISDDNKESQEEMLKAIENYVQTRIAKSNEEIRKDKQINV